MQGKNGKIYRNGAEHMMIAEQEEEKEKRRV